MPPVGNQIKLGIIALYWLPVHGGAEITAHRLANEFSKLGAKASVFTGSPEENHHIRKQLYSITRRGNLTLPNSYDELDQFLNSENYSTWCAQAVEWCIANRLTHIIFNNPFNHPQTRSFLINLKNVGVRVGISCYDFEDSLISDLGDSFRVTSDWIESSCLVRRKLEQSPKNERDWVYMLPCDFAFIATNWLKSFFEIFNSVPICVVHPLVDFEADVEGSRAPLEKVTVSMLNPSVMKGALQMLNVINSSMPSWTFRILKGGWGPGFSIISPFLESDNRIEFIDHVENIPDFYKASKAFLFPSKFEGYGLAAVEALLCGTPVVCTDLPSINEGVGDGALRVPLLSEPKQWVAAINEVIESKVWSTRAKMRVLNLKDRQLQEVKDAIEFLQTI